MIRSALTALAALYLATLPAAAAAQGTFGKKPAPAPAAKPAPAPAQPAAANPARAGAPAHAKASAPTARTAPKTAMSSRDQRWKPSPLGKRWKAAPLGKCSENGVRAVAGTQDADTRLCLYLVDLNGDGVAEGVVECGVYAGGCEDADRSGQSLTIYRKVGSSWQKLFATGDGPLAVSRTATREGWPDIRVTGTCDPFDGTGPQPCDTFAWFDGSAYQDAKDKPAPSLRANSKLPSAVAAMRVPTVLRQQTAEEQVRTVIDATTLDCAPTNSLVRGNAASGTVYEVKCGNDFSYLLVKPLGSNIYQAYSCAEALSSAPGALRCSMTRAEDAFEGVKKVASSQDVKCVQTTASWSGRTQDGLTDIYRVSCRGFFHPDVVVQWQIYRGMPRALPAALPVQTPRAGPSNYVPPRFHFDDTDMEPTHDYKSCQVQDAMSSYLSGSVQPTHCQPAKKRPRR